MLTTKGLPYDSSSDEESESHRNGNNNNNIEIDDVSGAASTNKNTSKSDSDATGVTNSSADIELVDIKEDDASKKQPIEDSNLEVGNHSTSTSYVSPTPQQGSSSVPRQHTPSATPPRLVERQPRHISSPPLAVGSNATGSGTYGLPTPPVQAGITPQTPPPNVNPLHFPLSPPSPPGRRFTGGLNRGAASSASQQHEQLLQQYNRQQAMLQQHRRNQHQSQTTQQQQQRHGSLSMHTSRGTENTNTTIPAPPGINHRNQRPHTRIHAQQTNGGVLQQAGNPFTSTSRNARDSKNTIMNTPRGRFVPHVVTISLDTEPFVETIVEEVISAGPAMIADDPTLMQSSGLRTMTVAATSNVGVGHSTTITRVTKTIYNVPGREAAFAATKPHVRDRRPRLGQLLSACPLDVAKASAVTCVKFSPCTDFCLIGYGVREPHVEDSDNANNPPTHPPYHPVTAMYEVNKGRKMRHVSTMLSGDDDVNIARFHPDSGYGFVYGTKQGRIRILGPRPWNYYNC